MNEILKLFTNFKVLKLRILLYFFGIKISKRRFYYLIYKQTEKGLKKYGKTIIECNHSDYNWNQMACEEIIDFYLYTLKNKKII